MKTKKIKDKFKLKKPFGKYKKGQVFESFDGLVRGLYDEENNQEINFDNIEYFQLV